ncbi:hypothetical protein PLESTB_001299300 [Pleodorina starrii]|uniref:Uncharacterized protein n=1 Tax=Pleodorina starrii TaxID=330485 RepID=A0A9W6BT79_9CHLO|nr:hypothetical protein PLESTM_000857200 [Pleodorina starrii]GLC57964.1 hypothetical protein PLESTB_001299300 [Pleodorina starrii]
MHVTVSKRAIAQEAAAGGAAAAAAAAAVKAQQHEAGPEAALGPVGAVALKLEAAVGPKAAAAPIGDAPGPVGGPWPAGFGREARAQGHAPGPETSGRGPAVLTMYAGREAAAITPPRPAVGGGRSSCTLRVAEWLQRRTPNVHLTGSTGVY